MVAEPKGGTPRSDPSSQALERTGKVLRYLDEHLTHRLPVPQPVWALWIYNETEDGVNYSLQPADDISNQGDACTDDISRAIVLAADYYALTESPRALSLVRRWSTFLHHVELARRPGVFAPFVYADGRLNVGGFNSRPPSKWVQGNVARAYAHVFAATGSSTAEEAFWRVRRKSTPDLKAIANRVEGDLTVLEAYQGGGETARRAELEARITRDVNRITTSLEREGYFADYCSYASPDGRRGTVQLWGYHQLAAVARAARVLDQPGWLIPCLATVDQLVDPMLDTVFPVLPHAWPVDAKGHPLAWPDTSCRWTGTAYHVSSLVAGLTELFEATGDKAYAERAVRISDWLLGTNPVGEAMYHPQLGGCYDGMLDRWINRNLGAESSIEAGRAELFRSRCEAVLAIPQLYPATSGGFAAS